MGLSAAVVLLPRLRLSCPTPVSRPCSHHQAELNFSAAEHCSSCSKQATIGPRAKPEWASASAPPRAEHLSSHPHSAGCMRRCSSGRTAVPATSVPPASPSTCMPKSLKSHTNSTSSSSSSSSASSSAARISRHGDEVPGLCFLGPRLRWSVSRWVGSAAPSRRTEQRVTRRHTVRLSQQWGQLGSGTLRMHLYVTTAVAAIARKWPIDQGQRPHCGTVLTSHSRQSITLCGASTGGAGEAEGVQQVR